MTEQLAAFDRWAAGLSYPPDVVAGTRKAIEDGRVVFDPNEPGIATEQMAVDGYIVSLRYSIEEFWQKCRCAKADAS